VGGFVSSAFRSYLGGAARITASINSAGNTLLALAVTFELICYLVLSVLSLLICGGLIYIYWLLNCMGYELGISIFLEEAFCSYLNCCKVAREGMQP
jgi:hypothetical protein